MSQFKLVFTTLFVFVLSLFFYIPLIAVPNSAVYAVPITVQAGDPCLAIFGALPDDDGIWENPGNDIDDEFMNCNTTISSTPTTGSETITSCNIVLSGSTITNTDTRQGFPEKKCRENP